MENVRDYKCPACGAGIRFDPPSQKWKCDYCRSVFEKADLEDFYQRKDERQRQKDQAGGPKTDQAQSRRQMDSYHCQNCGAEIIGDQETIATFCLYCKSPAIIRARMQGEFNPRYVIPFKIDQKQAKDLYAHWIKGHFLAPKEFKQQEEIEKIRGVYAPFWLYHSDDTQVYMEGTGETVRSWQVGDIEYTETSYYHVVRDGQIAYHNLPVDASTKMDDKAMDAIEPFDYQDMVDFSMDYMTGFFAERFDEGKDSLVGRAKARMDVYSRDRVRSTITGYSRFSPQIEKYEYKTLDAEYSLLPVYILTSIYQGKTMQYVVNGQTGKIYGQVPVSKARVFGVFGVAFLVGWILAIVAGLFLI